MISIFGQPSVQENQEASMSATSPNKPVYVPGAPPPPERFTAPKAKRPRGRVIAWILIVMGILVFTSMIDGKDSKGEPLRDPVGSAMFALALAAGGGFWLWSIRTRHEKSLREEKERAILTIAQRNDGVIDVATLCRETWMDSEEARDALLALSGRGVGQVDYDDEGKTFFRF